VAGTKKKISSGLKNPTEKILSAGFFYPLEKSLACGTGAKGATAGARAGFVFLQRINFKEIKETTNSAIEHSIRRQG
jgi:hypothetical protein